MTEHHDGVQQESVCGGLPVPDLPVGQERCSSLLGRGVGVTVVHHAEETLMEKVCMQPHDTLGW